MTAKSPGPPLPPPPVPVPVIPLPPGELGDALAHHYAASSRPRRPGVITAVGVASIVVACVSVVMSLVLALQAYTMYMATVMIGAVATARPRGAQQTAVQEVVVAEGTPEAEGTSLGLPADERDRLVADLTRRQPLTPSQRRQLEAVLTSNGRELGLEKVTESGTMPEDRSGLPGPEYFVTETGRLEIYRDRAVFFPLSGAQTIRISAAPPAVTPLDAEPESPATAPAATQAVAAQAVTFTPTPTMSLEALAMLVVSVVLSVALAVLLMSAGVMALRQAPKSRRMHLIYAALKIPVAIASGVAVMWLIDSFAAGVSSGPGGAGNFARWWGLGPAIIACLYPLALLIVLNTRSVREYYASVTPPQP